MKVMHDGRPVTVEVSADGAGLVSHTGSASVVQVADKAAGNYKGGYGLHPLQVYLDETREALGGLLRPGNAGANTAADHVAVIDRAIGQIPAEHVETLEILVRADSAGATHGLIDYCREANMRFQVGYKLTEQVRSAILEIPDDAWVPALDQDSSVRTNGEVCEITDTVDLSAWPRPIPPPRQLDHEPSGKRRQRALHPTSGIFHHDQLLSVDRSRRTTFISRPRSCRPRSPRHANLREISTRDRHDRKVGITVAIPTSAWLPAAARRRPPGVLRPARQAAPPGHLAVGDRTPRRVSEALHDPG